MNFREKVSANRKPIPLLFPGIPKVRINIFVIDGIQKIIVKNEYVSEVKISKIKSVIQKHDDLHYIIPDENKSEDPAKEWVLSDIEVDPGEESIEERCSLRNYDKNRPSLILAKAKAHTTNASSFVDRTMGKISWPRKKKFF